MVFRLEGLLNMVVLHSNLIQPFITVFINEDVICSSISNIGRFIYRFAILQTGQMTWSLNSPLEHKVL